MWGPDLYCTFASICKLLVKALLEVFWDKKAYKKEGMM